MAYGIQVYDSLGRPSLDTTIPMQQMQIISSGTASSITYNQDDFVLIRVHGLTSGATQLVTGRQIFNGSTYTMQFFNGTVLDPVNNLLAVSYLIVRPTKGFTAPNEYGFITYAADGTTRTFDSRVMTSSNTLEITNITPVSNGSQISYNHDQQLDFYNPAFYQWFSASWFTNVNITNYVVTQGLRFSYNHATYGSYVQVWSRKVSYSGTTYPPVQCGIFWGGRIL